MGTRTARGPSTVLCRPDPVPTVRHSGMKPGAFCGSHLAPRKCMLPRGPAWHCMWGKHSAPWPSLLVSQPFGEYGRQYLLGGNHLGVIGAGRHMEAADFVVQAAVAPVCRQALDDLRSEKKGASPATSSKEARNLYKRAADRCIPYKQPRCPPACIRCAGASSGAWLRPLPATSTPRWKPVQARTHLNTYEPR